MSHPNEKQVIELHNQGLSEREIAKKTGISNTTVHRIIVAGDEPPRDKLIITGKGEQWTVKLNAWIKLIYQAAMEQIPEFRGVTLDDFIYYCCDFAKRFFRLTPPGWATIPEVEVDLSQPPGWDSPEVAAAVAKLIKEVGNGGEPVGASTKTHELKPPQQAQQSGQGGGQEGALGEGSGDE
ncbi:hypothetical protein ES703_81160 [subsurface metagenome]